MLLLQYISNNRKEYYILYIIYVYNSKELVRINYFTMIFCKLHNENNNEQNQLHSSIWKRKSFQIQNK